MLVGKLLQPKQVKQNLRSLPLRTGMWLIPPVRQLLYILPTRHVCMKVHAQMLDCSVKFRAVAVQVICLPGALMVV